MIDFFLKPYQNASIWQIVIESVVFVLGILSVWFAKKEHIWVYPTGLIATLLTSYLLFKTGYFGDMLINLYFTVMSIFGWYNWNKKNVNTKTLTVSRTNNFEKFFGILLFFVTIFVVFEIYNIFSYKIEKDNYIDIVASGIFFTGMWYMAMKKIENWILWIVGNLMVIPLYFYRGLGMLSLQYLIFTILAILAYFEWKKALNNSQNQ